MNLKLAHILLPRYDNVGRKGRLKSYEEQDQTMGFGVTLRRLLGTEQWSPSQP